MKTTKAAMTAATMTAAAIMAAAIMAATAQEAYAGSYEVQPRLDGIVTDVKVGTSFGNDHFNFRPAARTRVLAQYDGDIDGITFLEASVGELYGFRAVGQARFFYTRIDGGSSGVAYPQAGIFYGANNDKCGVNAWLTSSIAETSITELRVDPKYTPKNNAWFVPDQVDAELYVWTPTLEPWKPSKERLRMNIGYEPIKGLLVGPAVEVEHTNAFTVQPGFFARAQL